MDALRHYRHVWLVDFEFFAAAGEKPAPLCVVARELRTGELVRHWLADGAAAAPPYPTGPDSLFVAYYSSAEIGCHLSLDWPMPARVLDLYVEFRNRMSGLPVPCGYSLLGVLAHFGLDALEAVEKEAMRSLAMRGGPYTAVEQAALVNYCQSDVDALARLLPMMLPGLDLPRALLRGRYMVAAAKIERQGIPLDVELFARLRKNWARVKHPIIAAVNLSYGVFVPTARRAIHPESSFGATQMETAGDGLEQFGPLTFSMARFTNYLERVGIPWPRLESGALALDGETFREMARVYPAAIGPLKEVLHLHRGELKRIELTVGADGCNRYLLSAFSSKTGRNQPSNSKCIFGPSTWLRSLIRPGPGRAIAYVDWSAQELAIAAALSGDRAMQDAYLSGDPYIWFAIKAGAVPANATKKTHAKVRDQFKVVMLGVLYGLSADGIARKLGVPPCRGRELLQMHRETFRRFWQWSDAVETQAILSGKLQTAFGWTVHVDANVNPRSLRNFPMQGNGAEMLRLACCLATERCINVCAPVHDALLVEGAAEEIEMIVEQIQAVMKEAGAIVLDGFELRTDAKIVRYPDRYFDERGRAFFERVQELLDDLERN